MHKLRTSLLATAALAALSVAAIPAEAADMDIMKAPPPAPAFSWTGLYLGVNAGWGNSHMSTQGFLPSGAPTSFNTGSANVSGIIFGGQLGYNWQFAPQWVVGIEGGIDGTGMNGFDYPAGCCFMWSKVDALASVTGRIGFTGWDPRTMIYAKGGWAWVQNQYMFSYGLNTTEQQGGWTVGAGIEWSPTFAPNWSFFAEYDYYGFGNHSTAVFGSSRTPSSAAINQSINTVKVGVNYRFSFLGR
ncbi:MAG: porin family protein [Hyphomicrobiales bacterium]|nr:porin family protein [Hyphomicrobiales bacterium]